MTLQNIHSFCKSHRVEVTQGSDLMYICEIDGFALGLGLTAIEAMENGINVFAERYHELHTR